MKSRSLKIANHSDFCLKNVLEKVKTPVGLVVGPSNMIIWMTQEFAEKFTIADNIYLTGVRISPRWGRTLEEMKIVIDIQKSNEFKAVPAEVGDGNIRFYFAKLNSETKYTEQIKKAMAFKRSIEIHVKTP